MAAFSTIALASAAAALGAGATVYATEEQKRMQRIARDQQQNAIDEQKAEMQKRQQEEEKMQVRDVSKAEKRTKSLLAGGRQSTLLTSPLGVVSKSEDQQQVASKNLLGM
jgi:hypothetical protein